MISLFFIDHDGLLLKHFTPSAMAEFLIARLINTKSAGSRPQVVENLRDARDCSLVEFGEPAISATDSVVATVAYIKEARPETT